MKLTLTSQFEVKQQRQASCETNSIDSLTWRSVGKANYVVSGGRWYFTKNRAIYLHYTNNNPRASIEKPSIQKYFLFLLFFCTVGLNGLSCKVVIYLFVLHSGLFRCARGLPGNTTGNTIYLFFIFPSVGKRRRSILTLQSVIQFTPCERNFLSMYMQHVWFHTCTHTQILRMSSALTLPLLAIHLPSANYQCFIKRISKIRILLLACSYWSGQIEKRIVFDVDC